jgi:hypothetical protein
VGIVNTDKATPELFAALATAQGEIENATKGSINPHFRSKYADLAEVLNTIRPVFSKHGLSFIQSTAFDGAMVHVHSVLAHASGGLVSSTASCVPAKTDAQGIGAATTYLRRYSAAAMGGIAQEDDDGQAAAHNRAPELRPSDIAPPIMAPSLRAKLKKTADYIIEAIGRDDEHAVLEAWQELSEEEMQSIWTAKTKGGFFDMNQKEYIRAAKHRAYESTKGAVA